MDCIPLKPKVGMTFDSLQELEEFIKNYGKQEKIVYTRVHSKRIVHSYSEEKMDKSLAEKLQIINTDYKCKFGGAAKPSTSTGERETRYEFNSIFIYRYALNTRILMLYLFSHNRTYNHGCLSIIKIHLSKDKTKLRIYEADLNHNNHPKNFEVKYVYLEYMNDILHLIIVVNFGFISSFQAFYAGIPEVRRLSPETKEKTMEFLKIGCNSKLIKNKLANEDNKLVTFKDLANLKASLKTPNDNNLKSFVDTLQKKHGRI